LDEEQRPRKSTDPSNHPVRSESIRRRTSQFLQMRQDLRRRVSLALVLLAPLDFLSAVWRLHARILSSIGNGNYARDDLPLVVAQLQRLRQPVQFALEHLIHDDLSHGCISSRENGATTSPSYTLND